MQFQVDVGWRWGMRLCKKLNSKLLLMVCHQCKSIWVLKSPDKQVGPCKPVYECVLEWRNTKLVV